MSIEPQRAWALINKDDNMEAVFIALTLEDALSDAKSRFRQKDFDCLGWETAAAIRGYELIRVWVTPVVSSIEPYPYDGVK